MAWRSISTPVVAVTLLGAVIALALLRQQPAADKWRKRRQTKAEKREIKRLGRKRGRAVTSKRRNSKRKEMKERLVQEIGAEEFRKMLQNDHRKREEQKERLQAARDNPESLRLAIDLHWSENASGKELSSLVKQLCYVYGRARASAAPPRLALTSYQGRAAAALKSAGAESWLVDRSPLGVFAVFDPASVVYLSPDADEALDEVVESIVYVVGGIVDRNLHKGLTLGAAEGARARAARLPFDEHLPEVPRGDRVLTVCACVGVLMGVHAGQGWREALEKSVPRRIVGVGKAAQRAARRGAWRGASVVSQSAGPGSSGWGVIAATAGNRSSNSPEVVGADASRSTGSGSDGCVGGGCGGISGEGGAVVEAGEPKEKEGMPSRSST
eukprot:g9123.t1